jgi:hypothetical protein
MNASATAASLATATALALPIEPDPIYAAIEVHRVAYAAWDKAMKLSDGNGPPSASIYLWDYPERKLIPEEKQGTNGDLVQVLTWRRTGKMKSIYASCPEHIKRDAPPDLKRPERDAWIETKCAELQAEKSGFTMSLFKVDRARFGSPTMPPRMPKAMHSTNFLIPPRRPYKAC